MDRSFTSLVNVDPSSKLRSSRRRVTRWLAVVFGSLIAIALLATAIVLLVWHSSLDAPSSTSDVAWPPPRLKRMGSYRFAAVSSDSETCSEIGRGILSTNGSAVDAAIATMLCIGVVHPQSTGIGGGSFMTVYDRVRSESFVYDFREEAPGASNETMYAGNPKLSTVGGLAVAVPGEIAGYRLAWERHGRLPWATLFRPSIELCESGVKVNRALAEALRSEQEVLRLNGPIREEFFGADGVVKSEGATIRRPRLARTLQAIADDPYSFYNGSLAASVVQDIADSGGIIDVEDLRDYAVKVKQPVETHLPNGGVRLLLPPPPASGSVLGLILTILDGFDFVARNLSSAARDVASTTLTLHRIVEAFKFGYAKRSELGDPDYVNVTQILRNMTSTEFAEQLRRKIADNATHDVPFYEPSFYNRTGGGTSHLSVVDSLGNAVAMTSTINLLFGAKFMGNRTGIIFNNEMDDFSSPGQPNSFGYTPSAANFIRPRKRPLSSMCPTIAVASGGGGVGEGEARLVFGAAGGSRIISASAMVAINHLYFGMTPKEAIDMPRMHHQLEPNVIRAEDGIPTEYRLGLAGKGHAFQKGAGLQNAVTNAVASSATSDGRLLLAYADQRKDGGTAGI